MVKLEGSLQAILLQLFPILCNPMDSSPRGSFAQEILWARILEWVTVPSSRKSFRLSD